ncbi:MAG TPA: HAMP domain-containing methyl-accepting chemotaxis protein [Solirubrobacteraceae bacterium]|nr:HAMP domain-containing methyl-accepting chemotaxis protein [Solirubrobacteraceae bacterium]
MSPGTHTADDAATGSGHHRADLVTSAGAGPALPSFVARLGVRGRLFGMAIALVMLGAICVVVATSGLMGQKTRVHSVNTAFKDFRTEHGAYEGWLTADDQMNMYAALAVLHDPKQRKLASATWGQVVQGHAQAVTALHWLIVNAVDPKIRAAANATLAELNTYYAFTMRMHAAALAGHDVKAVRLVTVDNARSSNRTQADFDRMGQTITDEAAAIDAQADSAASSSVQLVIIVALIVIVLAVLITLWLARSITRPLEEMTAAAEKISEGDLEVVVTADTDDEIGRLAHAFRSSVAYLGEMAGAAEQVADGDLTAEITPRSERDVLGQAFSRMRAKLAATIHDIALSSDSVGTASSEMAQSSQQAGMAVGEIANAVGSVAEGAERQVRSLERARAMTAQVAAASEASAGDAGETAAAARQAREVAEEGAEAVRRATDAMRAVHESSGEITSQMHELGSMSEQIGGIVDTITGIAEQTNLLALNAAIEAARAGEQGRGFAVVAEEVRKLAEESQTAAGSIADLIGQIQAGTTKAIDVVSAGARQTQDGVAIVEQARDAFERIDSSVQDMDERVQRINAAVAQIVASGTEMQESIEAVLSVAEQSSASAEQVSATTEQTSASAQQIAASAGELASTAESLQGVVRQFKLS